MFKIESEWQVVSYTDKMYIFTSLKIGTLPNMKQIRFLVLLYT